jgi:hypothetical protein
MLGRNICRLIPSSSTVILKSNVHVEAKIQSLGLKLPAPAIPKGSFINYTVVGNLAYLSGHLPQVRIEYLYYSNSPNSCFNYSLQMSHLLLERLEKI